MRLAGQAKCGFYPASPVAIAGILKHLRLADAHRDEQYIIDPCAGEGLAIKQLAAGLAVPNDHVYAVELDLGRTNTIRENIPGVNQPGGPAGCSPATYLGMQVTGWSFGLAYVNPPFDDELGGGRREEQSFVMRATHQLAHKGILVLVCPISAVIGNRDFVQYLDSRYEDIEIYRFPDGDDPDTGQPVRGYNEVVLFGRKRKTELPYDSLSKHGVLHRREWQWRSYVRIEYLPQLGERQPVSWNGGYPSGGMQSEVAVWEVPRGWKPNTFKKITFTEEELVATLAESPLNVHFKDVPPVSLKRPPLPLDRGHLGLILASGMLDGVVDGPHGPHVVRGSSTKVQYHNKELSTSEENPETGAVTTKDVYSERMVTIIRCVGEDGAIHTFSNDIKKDADEPDLIDD